MKLLLKLPILLALFSISLIKVIKAEDDVEDADVEIVDEDEIPEEEPVVNEKPEEPAPQLSPTPLEDVRSFVFFPDGPASITGGKMSEVVFGIQNNGNKDIAMVSANGKMLMPQTNEVVQNFTTVGYDNQAILSKSEASFSYMFMPAMQTGGREFQVQLEIYYKEKDTNMFYKAEPFNEKIQVLESSEGVTMEIAQLWMTIVALLFGGAYFLYQKQMAKKLIKEATAEGKKKVETGTVNQDIDMNWIPSSHGKAQKSK